MKKIISLALALVMICGAMVAFASCEKKGDTLVMATNAAFPPYEFKEGDSFAGIDVEIAQAIAEKLGKKLEIADVDFGAIIGGVQEGKYDFGMAGMTVTEKRLESVNFSTTYATGIQVIIVADGSAITSLDSIFVFDENGDPVSLKDTTIKVGVQTNTTGDIYSSSDVTGWGFNDLNEDGSTKTDRVTRFDNGAIAVEALKNGQVDVVIIDEEPAKSYVAANTGIKILDSKYAEEDYAIAVHLKSTELLAEINKHLKAMKDDGTLAAIVAKYIK
jgi:polar amino acid transport system substrate-binding protein